MPVQEIFKSIYLIITFLFLLGFIFNFFKKFLLARIVMSMGSILCFLCIILLIIIEKRIPLFGSFESTVYIIFLVSIIEIISKNFIETAFYKNRISLIMCIAFFIILLLQKNSPKIFNNDFFMYGNLWVNIFFNLRLVGAAFFIYAAIIANAVMWTNLNINLSDINQSNINSLSINSNMPSQNNCNSNNINIKFIKNNAIHMARNFLLIGVAIYLVSEWAGSLWCLNWLGDSWRWTKDFFKASIVFLFVMLCFHIPVSFKYSSKIKLPAMSFPAMFIIWMILFH
ncbi:MAG: hypothetical protein B6I26_02625 [Desulfobacteraceae bacterium 4572_130]|nr:MAG: hypothetical protein B6I26_02625 [Desulfobacteraceae bacterium 4572_130]